MRVTQSMMNENLMRNLNRNLRRLADKNDMMSSTKKIRRPSDDPVGAAMALRLRRQISAIEQYKSNAEDALTWMKNTETALGNTGEIMHRLRDLTIQAANGTMTLEDREKVLHEVQELKEQIFQEANSTSVDRYLFSGYNTDKPPFVKDADGKIIPNPDMTKLNSAIGENDIGLKAHHIEINGLDNKVEPGKYVIEISNYDGITADVTIKLDDGTPIVSENININENQVIKGAAGSEWEEWEFNFNLEDSELELDGKTFPISISMELTPGSMEYNLGKSESIPVNLIGPDVFADIFKTVEDLEKALENDDQEALSGDLIEGIKDDTNTILMYRSQIGARTNRLEATVNRLDANYVDYRDLLSNTEDVDMARIITELKMEESIYRAALATGARIIQPNLMDFMR